MEIWSEIRREVLTGVSPRGAHALRIVGWSLRPDPSAKTTVRRLRSEAFYPRPLP